MQRRQGRSAAFPRGCASTISASSRLQPRFRLSCLRRVVMFGNHKDSRQKKIIEEADMTDQQAPDMKLPDPVELSRAMARIAEQSQRLVADFMQRQAEGSGVEAVAGMSDPMSIGKAFLEMTAR